MSSVDQNIKKASPFLLFRQIAFATICTAVVLFLCRNIYLSSNRFVNLNFNIHYSNQAGNHWQIFYKSKEMKKIISLPPVFMKRNGIIKQTAIIPCKTLEGIRFDFGSFPGNVELSDVLLEGKQIFSIGDMTSKYSNQLNDLKIKSNGLTCASSKIDPYIFFQLKKPLKGKRGLDYWALAIIAISAFIIFLAVSRLLSFARQQNWQLYVVDGLLVILFLAALFIPASHIDGRKISVVEKRTLAPFRPLINSNMQINYQFGKNFDAWFNDHFFGRSMLLDLDSYLFMITRSPVQAKGKVFIGFNNWFFLSQENALRNYHNLDIFSRQQLERAAENLNKIQSICRRKGKKLYLVIAPDKHKVYGEYFPGTPKIRPDSQSRSRQLENHLKTHTSVPVINLLDTLLANKKQGFLYWKNNTHWNEMGAYIGYLEVMKQIQKDFPSVQLCKIDPEIPAKIYKGHGDLLIFTNGMALPEKTLYPVPRFKIKYRMTGDSLENYGTALFTNPTGRHNVLMIRDSFASSLLPYMGNSFKTITAIKSDYILYPNKIKAFQEADIVVFECVDRLLPFLLTGFHITRETLEQGVK